MRLGINMPFVREDGEPLTAKDIMARAVAIEAAGFDGIWIGDAIGRQRLTRPDPFLWLLPAAAATEHIEVGTAILQLPLRNPVELAQRFITIQALTRGRFIVGVGSGFDQGRLRCLRCRLRASLQPVLTVDLDDSAPLPG